MSTPRRIYTWRDEELGGWPAGAPDEGDVLRVVGRDLEPTGTRYRVITSKPTRGHDDRVTLTVVRDDTARSTFDLRNGRRRES